MINDSMKTIRTKIQQDTTITAERKTELLGLLAKLESEITNLSKTHSEHAESIAGFIEISTHEATRQNKHPELLKLSVTGLTESVRGFEASHPLLVAYINNIATTLANMGI